MLTLVSSDSAVSSPCCIWLFDLRRVRTSVQHQPRSTALFNRTILPFGSCWSSPKPSASRFCSRLDRSSAPTLVRQHPAFLRERPLLSTPPAISAASACFAYPLILEPHPRLHEQIRFWSLSFWILAGCILGCALLARSRRMATETSAAPGAPRRGFLENHSQVGRSLVRAIQPHARRHELHHHRCCQRAAPLGASTRTLPFTFVIAFSKHSKSWKSAAAAPFPSSRSPSFSQCSHRRPSRSLSWC